MSKEELLEEFKKLNKNSSVKDLQEYTKNMIKTRGFENETPQDILLLNLSILSASSKFSI